MTPSGHDADAAAAAARDPCIRIVVAGTVLPATLADSAAARAFAAMLPLDCSLADFHATEKIADLPARLPTDDAPHGVDAASGDIAYYAPWGNLALFYRDFGHARGLVRLGRITGDVAVLASPGPLPARIERVPPAD